MKSPVARIQIAGWQESNCPWQGIKSLAGSNEITCGKDSNRWLAVLKLPVANNEITCGKDSNRWLAGTKLAGWQAMNSLAGKQWNPFHYIGHSIPFNKFPWLGANRRAGT